MTPNHENDELWRKMLHSRVHGLRITRSIFKVIPSNPRCKICYSPFAGFGGPLMRLIGRKPLTGNPNFCDYCEKFARRHPGGAETELTYLFADVRGSTQLAEQIGTTEFTRLLKRFYAVATKVVIQSDGVIDKLVGDEIVAFYLPSFAGEQYTGRALEAAQELLQATGHADPIGPWIPLGIGIHTGTAYFGVIGTEDTFMDITALGDVVNTTARLSSVARAGEILISDPAALAAGLQQENLEHRQLELKGKSTPLGVSVLHTGSP